MNGSIKFYLRTLLRSQCKKKKISIKYNIFSSSFSLSLFLSPSFEHHKEYAREVFFECLHFSKVLLFRKSIRDRGQKSFRYTSACVAAHTVCIYTHNVIPGIPCSRVSRASCVYIPCIRVIRDTRAQATSKR